MTAGTLGLDLLAGAATVLVAIVAARLAHGVGLPALLVFLGLGLLLGDSGIGIRFSDAQTAETLGLAALVLILAEGGLTTNWEHARKALPAAITLATAGVVITIGVVACCTHLAARRRLAGRAAARRGPRARPTRPRSSPCCAGCRCRRCSRASWRASRDSTTRRRCSPSPCSARTPRTARRRSAWPARSSGSWRAGC